MTTSDDDKAPELSRETHVTAGELNRNFGEIQARARHGPVVVTHHGRPRVAIVSIEDYEKLKAAKAPPDGTYRRKLSIVLDCIQECYVSLDRDWTIVSVNRMAELFIGMSRDELVGLDWRTAFPNTRGSVAEDHLRRVFAHGEVVAFETTSLTHPPRTVAIRMFPLPLPGGGAGILFSTVSAGPSR